MSFWNIFGNLAVSDNGETMTRLSDTMSVSTSGVTYSTMGNLTVGSDGSTFTQIGNCSTDGSTRMGSTTTGLGAVFNKQDDSPNSKVDKFGMDDDDF